jgi:integrase
VNYAVRFDVLEESPFRKALDRDEENKPKNELSPDECAAFVAAFDDRDAFLEGLRGKYRRGETTSCERYPTPRVFGGSRRWDSEAAQQLWESFRWTQPFFIVALTTGLRLGDLCRMTWADVSWKNAWIQLKMEKTRHEVVVPISEPCKAALKECQSRPIVAEIVFVDEAGAPLSVTRIRRAFALAKQLAGITRTVRFHDLRHTYGSSLSSDGLSLAIIGKVMGHKHQATTARYARPDNRVIGKVRQSVNRLFRGIRSARR